jgi:hypothetical protein
MIWARQHSRCAKRPVRYDAPDQWKREILRKNPRETPPASTSKPGFGPPSGRERMRVIAKGRNSAAPDSVESWTSAILFVVAVCQLLHNRADGIFMPKRSLFSPAFVTRGIFASFILLAAKTSFAAPQINIADPMSFFTNVTAELF